MRRSTRLFDYLIFVAALAAVLYCGYLVFDELQHGSERRQRAHVRQTMDEAKLRSGCAIFLSDDKTRDEFVKEQRRLAGAHDVELYVEYGHGADRFFAGIRGLAGVTFVIVGKTDLSEEGLKHIATLPDLESLILHHLALTGAGLDHLRSSPSLRHLGISPASGKEIDLPELISSATVKTLSIGEPYQEAWLKEGVAAIDLAPHLEELQLTSPNLTVDDVVALRRRIPNCIVRAFRRDAGPDKEEIAP